MNENELNKKIETWLYFLVKNAARNSYAEFKEEIGISDEEYEQIKSKVESTFGINLYV